MKFTKFFVLIILSSLIIASNALATTYYVSKGGSNSNRGASVSEPWATLNYAASHISTGDIVVVRSGIYKENISINVKNVTFENYPGEQPILDWDFEGPGGKKNYTAMISVVADGVTVKGFEVRESTGTGISVYGKDGGTANNVTIKNCKIHDTWYPAFRILDGADNCTVEDCEIYKGSYVMSNCSVPFNASICRAEGWGDPATIQINNCAYATFRRCVIRDGYNEGFDIDRYSSNTTVEYCQIYGHPAVQLYICSSNNQIIRYNIIYGTNTNENGQNGYGPGIYINNEDNWKLSNVENFIVYGNCIANTARNFWVASQYVGGEYHRVSKVYAYNNTFIEARGTSNISQVNVLFNDKVGDGHIFVNNIIWQTEGSIGFSPNRDIITSDYNLWSKEPVDKLKGAHDPPYAVPNILKTTDWKNLYGGEITGSEFSLQKSSPAIDKGIALTDSYDWLIDTDVSNWVNKEFILKSQKINGTGWEIGADIYCLYPTSPPIHSDLLPPSNLKIISEE